MPLLTDTATREPITVADFEEAFSASHPSINSDHQWQEEQQLLLEQERQQQGTPMRLFIKTLTGKTVTIPNIFPDDTVEFLKVEVAKREGIPPGQQRLIYTKAECQQMRDHTREDRRRPLSHYGVTDGAVIHLVLRLSGD